MAKKLQYFDYNGHVEAIRYILHYGGHKFEDVKYGIKEWPIKSVKESLPYGQMPYYEEGEKGLNQTFAIARYVASQSGLLPSDPWEQAQLDAAVLNIYDFWKKANPMVTDPEKVAAQKKLLLEEIVPYFFSRFEKELQNNNGHFGGRLTWADFALVGIIEAANLVFKDNIEKDYPSIVALVKTVHNLPNVKEYIASRKPYSL